MTVVILVVSAILSFHLAYGVAGLSCLIAAYVCCLSGLADCRSPRLAFYIGLVIGLAIYAPQLGFFWTLFGPPALTLWFILAFWLGLFLSLAHLAHTRLGRIGAVLLLPFLWTGLEYFRSECYYLRFSWLSVGYAFSESLFLERVGFLGVYGIGFVIVLALGILSLLPRRIACAAHGILLAVLALLTNLPAQVPRLPDATARSVAVAGLQWEFPAALEIPSQLDKLAALHPEAELFVLSEYTFDGPVPQGVKDWCRKKHRYLVAGGKQIHSGAEFSNTAFVIGPDGEVVFEQIKSVPIQFFKDGRPAPTRKVWDSPWGKIGICVCYDLSYTRVVDDFIRQGAQALIVPTMDVREWGVHQHRLHARVGPVRAAEYAIPIFRLTSSGISQVIDRRGHTQASAPFGGEGEIIAGQLDLQHPGRFPLDRVLGPLSVFATGLFAAWLLAGQFCVTLGKSNSKLQPAKPGSISTPP